MTRLYHIAGRTMYVDENRYRIQRCSICGALLHFSPTTQMPFYDFPENGVVISASPDSFTAKHWRQRPELLRTEEAYCWESFVKGAKE